MVSKPSLWCDKLPDISPRTAEVTECVSPHPGQGRPVRFLKMQISGSVIRPTAIDGPPDVLGARTNAPKRIQEQATRITKEGPNSGFIRDNIGFLFKSGLDVRPH